MLCPDCAADVESECARCLAIINALREPQIRFAIWSSALVYAEWHLEPRPVPPAPDEMPGVDVYEP